MIERDDASPVARRSVETEPDSFETQVAHSVVAALLVCPQRPQGRRTPSRANRYLLFPSSSRTVPSSIQAPSTRATKSPASSKTPTCGSGKVEPPLDEAGRTRTTPATTLGVRPRSGATGRHRRVPASGTASPAAPRARSGRRSPRCRAASAMGTETRGPNSRRQSATVRATDVTGMPASSVTSGRHWSQRDGRPSPGARRDFARCADGSSGGQCLPVRAEAGSP